ncbi:NACHT domain-containing NTPase [Actinomycetospora sp. TBRC 11914]|uniref:NACHT domain-containing protein n=1 Tax=Actinomycetospora sp. TBRC 11914 TaxID=2729387 RepID=UPI00145D52C1|nr:hypothetical protein [Actinomycetospora sp. TBRC 11914]NMO90608.1 hypothetical protein [Actinomycetospora sp. TBRC 11914]
MTFFYEQLDPERFQHFVQALLAEKDPHLRCLPVGQPDGGQDAWTTVDLVAAASGKPAVDSRPKLAYQVKFVRNPDSIEDPHRWLVETIEKELPKPNTLAARGAVEYILVTNVRGTAHPDVGSIDQLQRVLDDRIDIPSTVWWRGDVDRRVETASASLRWSYPEILRGNDLLELLFEPDAGSDKLRRQDAIRAFLIDQKEKDEEVRFKQVELQNDLISLFVDVPAQLTRVPGGRRAFSQGQNLVLSLKHASEGGEDRSIQGLSDVYCGAAILFLNPAVQEFYPIAVIQGAPGQGKSTLAQYLCQVYRMQALGNDLSHIPYDRQPKLSRLPFKVDLRDYAVWVRGRNPFDEEERVEAKSRSVEAFCAALVEHHSGGKAFSVDDLHSVLKTSPSLLMLDGLDEVADLDVRERVVKEISAAARRFREIAANVQVVVTTRPSAFSGVSDFPQRTFAYFDLVSLTPKLVLEYADRWTKAKKLDAKNSKDLRFMLRSRLEQAHLRELARNPMQLAILLSVVHSRGPSLPDKRTALYGVYVTLFLSRESEKNDDVREHQELLVDVHCYLAWLLHARAEAENESGRISYDDLMAELRSYLIREGRDSSLAEAIFSGSQRVVFLVARIEGTFEFEVQPLREYFAGRYLYETAAYSPVGSERGGTMPDRFDGIAPNPYWQNVTRFFAGFLDKGELPALVERLTVLITESAYQDVSYPGYLAGLLLRDWVFSRNVRSQQQVISLILRRSSFLALLSRSSGGRRPIALVLPDGAGKSELLTLLFEEIDGEGRFDPEKLRLVGQLLQANATREELVALWKDNYAAREARSLWVHFAYYLGIMASLSIEDLRLNAMPDEEVKDCIQVVGVVTKNAISVQHDLRLTKFYLESVLRFPDHRFGAGRDLAALQVVSTFAGAYFYTFVFIYLADDTPARHAARVTSSIMGPLHANAEGIEGLGLSTLVVELDAQLDYPLSWWRTSLDPWTRITNGLGQYSKNSDAVLRIAILSSQVKAPLSVESSAGLYSSELDMTVRLRLSKLRAGNYRWWTTQFKDASSEWATVTFTSAFFMNAGPTVLRRLLPDVDRLVSGLSDSAFNRIADILEDVQLALDDYSNQRIRARLSELTQLALSPRTKVLAISSMPRFHQPHLADVLLPDYTGTDTVVLERLIDWIARKPNSSARSLMESDWRRLAEYSKVMPEWAWPRSLGDYPSGGTRNAGMPLELAQLIVSSDDYPLSLKAHAEEVCEQAVFEAAVPVMRIAEEEQWFVD